MGSEHLKRRVGLVAGLASTCTLRWAWNAIDWILRLQWSSRRSYPICWSSAVVDLGNCSRKYMNCKAVGNRAYIPTELEHIANVITHGLWVIPSLFGFHFLIQRASDRTQYMSALVYGCAIVALFTISTIFHSVFYLGRFRHLKDILHRCDRAVIYLFIAASYTPWLTLKPMCPGFVTNTRWLVWVFACLGIVYQHLYHERYKWLETCLYLLLGLLPSVAIFNMPEWSGLYELAVGGVVYIVGIYFFKSDGCIPCAHAIWHLFVVVGATFHYYAVCKYLMGKSNEFLVPT